MKKIEFIVMFVGCMVFAIIMKLHQGTIVSGGSIFSHKNIMEVLGVSIVSIPIAYVLYKYGNKDKKDKTK